MVAFLICVSASRQSVAGPLTSCKGSCDPYCCWLNIRAALFCYFISIKGWMCFICVLIEEIRVCLLNLFQPKYMTSIVLRWCNISPILINLDSNSNYAANQTNCKCECRGVHLKTSCFAASGLGSKLTSLDSVFGVVSCGESYADNIRKFGFWIKKLFVNQGES